MVPSCRTLQHDSCLLSIIHSVSHKIRCGGYASAMTEEEIKKESGRRIREDREQKQLSREDVCRLAGWDGFVSRLGNYENGYRMIGVIEAMALSKILGVTPGYLLTIEGKNSEALSDLILAASNLSEDKIGLITATIKATSSTKLSRREFAPDRITLNGNGEDQNKKRG